MKTVTVNKTVNLSLLTEELFRDFPSWKTPHDDPPGSFVTEVIIFEEPPGFITVIFPDSTNENAVRAVINAHIASKLSKNQERSVREEGNRTSARAKLRVLGLTDEEIATL